MLFNLNLIKQVFFLVRLEQVSHNPQTEYLSVTTETILAKGGG